MQLSLIPQPKQLQTTNQHYTWPARAVIGIADQRLYAAARQAVPLYRQASIHAAAPGLANDLTLRLDGSLRPRSYTLVIGPATITIAGADEAAVWYGVQTLAQLVAQADDGSLPTLSITDWPDFADRGIYYDVCRGRVPTLPQLLSLADELSRYKINQLQLYIEHTFAFRGHPKIGRGASPLTAEDILTLDAFCRERHIELVPSLASFGHLATVLKHPEYHHLAEDKGVGAYEAPDEQRPAWFGQKGWTLTPAKEESYAFLASLFAEFLPLFSSSRFNICCDETWDLGMGQSYRMCQQQGKGRVYLDHIVRVRDLAAKFGKTTMFWGDIIRHYPELIKEIPADVTVLDWAYSYNHDFDRIRDFAEVKLPFYACPGTSSWVSLFPRLPEAVANIHGFAAAGFKHGAQGLLTTDWGDGGHYNFMEFSWHGFLCGAEQGWNTGADLATYTARFTRLFLETADAAPAEALDTLGEVTHLWAPGYYQSIWQHLFFAKPGDKPLTMGEAVTASVSENGKIGPRDLIVGADLGRQTLARLAPVRDCFAAYAKRRDVDPLGVLPYWIFAVDTIAHAARKLTVLGPGGHDTPAGRRQLKQEMRSLRRQFEKLWMARNRRSEIQITLRRYDQAIEAL